MKRLRVLVLSLSILLGSTMCASAITTVKEGNIIKNESKLSKDSVVENIKASGSIIIEFKEKIDTKDKNCVFVYEKESEKNIDVNISFSENEKELIITPKDDLKNEMEYIVYIINLKYKDNNQSVFDMYSFKTKKYVEEKQEDKKDVVKKEINDEIFKKPGVEKYLSTEYVSIEDGIVYVSQNSSAKDAIRHYRPENNYFEDINEPIYNLLKSRLEDNERGNYTRAVYVKNKTTNYSKVAILISESRRVFFPLYGFSFEEKNIDKDINPYEAPIRMTVNSLYDTNSEVFCDKHYVDRLKKDFIVLFGKEGTDICDYVVSKYIYKSNEDKYFKHKKEFENITVYSEFKEGARMLEFFFVKNDKGDK